jgi:hypothetical protein
MFLLETRFFKNTGRYGSVEIIFENSNAFGGFCPRHWDIPIAMTMYYLLPNSDYRNAPRPPTGDWWRKRGHYFIKKKVFYRAEDTLFKKRISLQNHPEKALIAAINSGPYFSSLWSPTPAIALKLSLFRGFTRAISLRLLSWNMI